MGTIYAVGIGPGNGQGMTAAAADALARSDVLCGYDRYIELIAHLYPDKPRIATGMTREVERCRAALAAGARGDRVAVICSGDAGVYGMAGLLYQLSAEYEPVDIEVVPGVSAAMAGAALLGAPLMHDFAVISLSDLLTPWPLIEKRVRAAAEADFVLCLYNPASRKRADYLQNACSAAMESRDGETVCGWVRNIGRDGEEYGILPLRELRDWQADMFTTIFIGNSATTVINGKMVTPRGYRGI
ncbi:MAG: precorrin-3B C(17)-methyltransferase [Planctomycetes bacterium]|nr:precorrin-3B C(17)-methyltransferase [Planctomycetota bacterium]